MLKDTTKSLQSERKEFPFFWIPEHCGIPVKERADSEAKQSIKEGTYSQC
jgi:ribonuclease HI